MRHYIWALELSRQVGRLGSTLLAAACVAYLGPFPKHARDAMREAWIREVTRAGCLISSSKFELHQTRSSDDQVRRWVAAGLPPDQGKAVQVDTSG